MKNTNGRHLRESDIKRSVEDYLQYRKNLGKLIYFRLNAGSFVLTNPDGSYRRRIKGAPSGTADFIVIQGGEVQMFHTLQQRIHKTHPVAFVTFIECKSSKGKQSLDQVEFQEKVKKLNCGYYIVRSVDELVQILRRE